MAADYDAVLTTLRGILVDNNGSVRKVGSGRFRGNLFDADAETAKVNAIVKPRVEVRLVSASPHPKRPLRMGTFTLDEFEVEVLVVRDISGTESLIDSRRDDIRALAANDSSLISQAFEWAGSGGNVAQTAGSTVTNIVSGVLTWTGSELGDVEVGASGARIESRHKFRGVLNVSTPTS